MADTDAGAQQGLESPSLEGNQIGGRVFPGSFPGSASGSTIRVMRDVTKTPQNPLGPSEMAKGGVGRSHGCGSK